MPIIDDDILTEALSRFDLSKLVPDIEKKKKILEEWITAIDNGDIRSEGEDQNKPQFFQKIFTEILGYQQEKSLAVKNLIIEERTLYDKTKPDAILGFFRIENGSRKKEPVFVVVEVKSLNTVFLKKERERYSNPLMQANEYRFKIGCDWIIITDFQKIQLFQYSANEYEEFIISKDLVNHREMLIRFFFFLHKNRLLGESESNPSPIKSLLEMQKNSQYHISNQKPTGKNRSSITNMEAKEINIIDLIYQALTKYKGLNFVNPVLISSTFPFNTDEEKVFHYNSRSYSIQSTNNEVYKLFSSIRIEDNEVVLSDDFNCQDATQKVKEIIQILNKSLIYSFQGYENIEIVEKYLSRPNILAPSLKYELGDYENQLRTFNIHLKEEDKVADIIEMHLNLQFDKILNRIRVSEGKPDFFSFEIGYACSLLAFDDYKKSFIIYKTLADKQKRQTTESKVNYFLSKLNLKYLFSLISGHYWLEDRDDMLSEIRQIDLDAIFAELNFADTETREAIRELKENKLFIYAKNRILEYNQNIKEAYKRYENGGYQYGPHYPSLQWTEFVLTFENYTGNYILHEMFSEFSGLYQTMFNSFLISYATDNDYNEKLKKFDYYHIVCAFLYLSPAKTEELLKTINLKEIAIDETDKKKLFLIILNFLRCNHQDEKETMFGDVIEKKQFTTYLSSNFSFKNKYYRIFENIFQLISRITFTSENIQEILKSIIRFIKVDNGLGRTEYNYLAKWVSSLDHKVVQGLLPGLLEAVLDNIITNKIQTIGPSIFIAIVEQIYAENKKYEFPNHSLISKMLILITENDHCTYSDVEILISLWRVSNVENQNEIKTKLLKILSSRFEPIIYTKLVSGGLIAYDHENLFEKYVDIYSNYKAPQFVERKNKKYLRDYSFNYFVEFVFSQEINIKGNHFKKFAKLEGYYYWLLNYDDYDYNNFNPEWILFWHSATYMNRFAKICEIGREIRKFLKLNYDEQLAEIYFQYFEE